MNSIKENDTQDLVELPKCKHCIHIKWVYKTKFDGKGKIEKYKPRLVAINYTQKPRVHYGETFALIARLYIVKAISTIVVQNGWNVYQMDVKSTILCGIL